MKRVSAVLSLGMVFLASCATSSHRAKEEPKFHEANNADVVIRYYTENVTRILKPVQMEGPFFANFDRTGGLELAKQQPGRELAVVILLEFNSSDRVKWNWLTPLKEMGYKRIVFLRAEKGLKVDGLSIMADPGEITEHPKKQANPNV
jgi:hypothetical protein